MDYKKLSGVQSTQVKDSLRSKRAEEIKKRKAIKDSQDKKKAEKEAKMKAIQDAIEKRRAALNQPKDLKAIKDSDSYKALRAKIKDALDETETTEDAIEAVRGIINCPECDPEEAIVATLDIMGEIVDLLQDKISDETPEVVEKTEETKVEETVEDAPADEPVE